MKSAPSGAYKAGQQYAIDADGAFHSRDYVAARDSAKKAMDELEGSHLRWYSRVVFILEESEYALAHPTPTRLQRLYTYCRHVSWNVSHIGTSYNTFDI